jgi:hypothetical protein
LSTGVDIHEFTITQVTSDTALLSAYVPKEAHLTSVGGSSTGWVLDSYFEEYVTYTIVVICVSYGKHRVDVFSGKVLFAWNASAHVPYNESYATPLVAAGQSGASGITGKFQFVEYGTLLLKLS